MKFTALPVHDLTDVTLDLEQLQTRDILDQSSTTVLQLAVIGTKRKVAFGTVSLTWTASALSAAATVTHGLGVTPILYATFDINSGGPSSVASTSYSPTSTQFTAVGQFVSGTFTGSKTMGWLAIG